MPSEHQCPKCGAVLPADAPKGLCPRCLMAAALEESRPAAVKATIRVEPSAEEEPIEKIDRYKILQKLGEGGCGVVYMAEQTEPVRRKVAVKVIKLGMDTKQVIARFEAERQALALMDHPNIAKVLDAGTTEKGRPYFVMELVKGIRITDYCDQNHLSTAERLGLFTQACQAIQHAHQKGIIHRDIKPSNILVTLHDGKPVPKVIDFGIAKATEQPLTEKTVFTAFGQFMGTPAYMSPEQAELSGLDIDTRSDIYALGVLLYELLTGKTPFDAKELLQAGLDEMRRRIREEEPMRPSTRLSTMMDADLTEIAEQRRSEPGKLTRFIRGDLDWIVMKCLEKDRTRRYETANGLATDIRRHLENEPVLACPPSTAYRFQKMVRRNKLTFISAGVVTAALLFGISISTWQSVRATRGERQQIRLRADIEKAVSSEAKERTIADERLYDSLLSQVRGIIHSRQVGYRDTVFTLLKQARSLNVQQKDFTELRREAMACMGDFVGLMPATFPDFPKGTLATRMQISPTGRLAAFGLSSVSSGPSEWTNKGAIALRELPSGAEVVLLTNDNETADFCFNTNGDQIIALHAPRDQEGILNLRAAQLDVWTIGMDGQWRLAEKVPVPGGARCFNSSKGLFVAVCNPEFPFSNVWRLIDLKTRKAIQTFNCQFIDEGHIFPHLALSPDGKYLAVPAFGIVDLWDLATHKRVHTFNPRVGLSLLAGLEFSPDGKYLACFGQGGCIIYAMDNFRQLNIFKEEFSWPDSANSWPRQISIAPNDNLAALPVLGQNSLRLWDFGRNREIAALKEVRASRLAAFSPDGRFLLTDAGSHPKLYQLWQTPERMRLPYGADSAAATAFSPDGTRIAFTTADATLRLADVMTGRTVWQSALACPSFGVVYSTDGQMIITGGGSAVQFWNSHTGKLLLELGTNQIHHPIGCFQLTRNNQILLIQGPLGTDSIHIDIWVIERHESEYADGNLNAKLSKMYDAKLPINYSLLPGFVLAQDARHVVFLGYNGYDNSGRISICDLNSSTPPRVLRTNVNVLGRQPVTQASGRNHLLVVNGNNEVVTLDIATGAPISSFPLNPQRTTSSYGNISLSPDGTKLAVVESTAQSVKIYNPNSGRLLYSLPEENGLAIWLTWSPDSQRLSISRSNGEIDIWNISEVEQTLTKLELSP